MVLFNEQRCLAFSLLLLLLSFPSARAQGKKADIASRMNRLVKERFAATTCPGLSVTVAARNELVFIFGTRNGRP